MVRLLRGVATGGSGSGFGAGLLAGLLAYLWFALLSVCIISAIVFSCADGVPKEKTSTADTELYGGGCAAGCAAGCGAGCGA